MEMIKELIEKVIESMREDCKNITYLYGERSCAYCKHREVCEAIYKSRIKR